MRQKDGVWPSVMQRVESEGLALRRSGSGIGDIIHAHGPMHVSWRICDEIRD